MREQLLELLKQTTTPLPSVLFHHYRTLQLTSDEVMWLVQYVICHGDTARVAVQMGMRDDDMAKMINGLLEKQHITMQTATTTDGKIDVVYSVDPLFQKLATLLTQQDTPPVVNTKDLITTFEQEFGRALSGMELDMLSGWVKEDRFEESVILMALKEAVISQALSLKYIDRILLSWKKKNITTAQQVQQEVRKYRQQATAQEDSIELDEHTLNVLMMQHTK